MQLAYPLILVSLLGFGCAPGKQGGVDDTDSAGTTDTGTSDTTGEPTPAGVLAASVITPDVAGVDLAVAADGSLIVIGYSGYSYEGGDGGAFKNTWIGKFDPAGALLWANEAPIA